MATMRKKSRPGRRQPARAAGKIWIACAMLAVFTAGACGYRFAGGGRLPEGAKTLSVGVFENQTRESGLEHLIANEVIHQFTRFGTVELTDQNSAQAVLTGRIRSAGITTIAHKTTSISAERRIRVVVVPTLTTPNGRVLWSGGPIADDETFFVGTDRLQTDQNKKSALTTLSKRIAERIYYQMTDY